eukprot:11913151-Prorocentrum_lima.AAC.1
MVKTDTFKSRGKGSRHIRAIPRLGRASQAYVLGCSGCGGWANQGVVIVDDDHACRVHVLHVHRLVQMVALAPADDRHLRRIPTRKTSWPS